MSLATVFYHAVIDAVARWWHFGVYALAATIALEHVARVNKLAYSPGRALSCVAEHVTRFFESLGRLLAVLSSFLERLQLYELGQSALAIVEPLWQIATAGVYVLVGYAKAVGEYAHPGVVVLGSLVLAGGATYALGIYPVALYRAQSESVQAVVTGGVVAIAVVATVACAAWLDRSATASAAAA